MGGMAVLKYLQEHPHARIDGAIIASPLLNLTKPIPWWKRTMLEYCTEMFGEFFIRYRLTSIEIVDIERTETFTFLLNELSIFEECIIVFFFLNCTKHC